MNSLQQNTYTWEDTITIILSNGLDFKIKLSDLKDSEYIWYTCSSCGEETTLANGECGSCLSPFEPQDIEEAKSITHDTKKKVKIESLERLIFILNHRSWMCKQCNSFNMNYPRWIDVSQVSCGCINCWKTFTPGESLLFEDGYSDSDIESATADFSKQMNQIIQKESLSKNWDNENIQSHIHHRNPINSHIRNKLKVIVWSFWWVWILLYVLNHAFFEEVNHDFEILSHSSLRTIGVEKHLSKTSGGWERDISSLSYDNFEIINRYQKEDSSDSYKVQIGTKMVEDTSNCLNYDDPLPVCSIVPEDYDYAVVNWLQVKWNYTPAHEQCISPEKSCIEYGEKPEAIMETRYHKHPYVHFSYTQWEEIKREWEPILWKIPKWPDMSMYDFSQADLREWKHRESYSVTISYNNKKKQIQLGEDITTWNSLDEWYACTIEASRAYTITAATLKNIESICEGK